MEIRYERVLKFKILDVYEDPFFEFGLYSKNKKGE